ncbi:cell surface glycoprotein CD200 receptor 1 isoform X4 [Sphaeramia orbicularis]|uniref:cell surface glycoprotein CD200 receptor 1 isoform X4 n=1 Tax=Sphaeramia orbicularis TaxID=375764 RepID=UPI00117E09AB|nr:cell surface glycoprotein CD200 receptor 1-like isoform X4 [Sphaeramia orbicularis]
MKEMKLVYAAIIFLVSEAWSLDQAFSRTNQSTSEMKLNATSSSSPNYVPPKLSSWLDWKGNKMVAVCKAEGGIPAANISWSHTGNTSTVETRDSSDGFFTVESRLELPTDMQTENVSCAISHLSWEHEESLMIKIEKAGRAFSWVHLAIPISIAFFLGFLFFGQKKLVKLRRGQESVVSSSKSPQTDDVEEVEPYASYVQRVNSIYNSSLDMFT